MSGSDRLSCVQWATGNIGARALRGIIEHPRLELAGVHVTSSAKVGVDAGELCGLDPIGVFATNRLDDIIELRPDCVLYMPAALDVDEVARLLEAGIDIVTTRGEFHRPSSMNPELRKSVERACTDGQSTIHSTGSSPGFITEAVPILLASLQRRLTRIGIDEYADLSQRNSPELLFDIMGFGRPPAEFDESRLDHLRDSFGPSLHTLAESLGMHVEAIAACGEVAVIESPITIAAGTLPAGSVGAQRVTVAASCKEGSAIRFRANWYCTTDLEPQWDLMSTGWRVDLDGDAPLRVDIRMPIAPERLAETTPGYTANRAVNAVRHVCEAPPGILTSVDLPQFVPEFA